MIEKCPVCEGRGIVPSGFYQGISTLSFLVPEPCRICNGKGVILISANRIIEHPTEINDVEIERIDVTK